MSNFRYSAKSIFLTYAKCPVSKEDMLLHLKARARPQANELVKACIAQEQHKDGDLHLHVAAWYSQKLEFRKADHMDYVDGP